MGTRIELWISDELAAELDEARGSVARGRWIGELLAAELHGPTYPSGPLPSTEGWRGAHVPGFPVQGSITVAGGWCAPAGSVPGFPMPPVDDPAEEFVPVDPARSRKIWDEVGERLAAERDPGPDPV